MHWILDTWQAAVFIVAVFWAWGLYWMHSKFVSQKKLQEMKDQNQDEHGEIKSAVHKIKSDVSWIKGYMERDDDKHG